MSDHVHNPTVPICPCGYRWQYRVAVGRIETTYTSAEVVALYRARHGEPVAMRFEEVQHEP